MTKGYQRVTNEHDCMWTKKTNVILKLYLDLFLLDVCKLYKKHEKHSDLYADMCTLKTVTLGHLSKGLTGRPRATTSLLLIQWLIIYGFFFYKNSLITALSNNLLLYFQPLYIAWHRFSKYIFWKTQRLCETAVILLTNGGTSMVKYESVSNMSIWNRCSAKGSAGSKNILVLFRLLLFFLILLCTTCSVGVHKNAWFNRALQ